MAAIYSQGSKESREGTWYERGALRKELADVAFGLKPGQCSGAIDVGADWYVLLVDEANPAHYKPLSEVRDQIESDLKAQEKTRLEKQWLDRLRKKTFVQYFY